MPLRDHFHTPWSEEDQWEGFYSAWVNSLVRHLNGSILPRRFRAQPQVHLGTFVEADIAILERHFPPGPPPDVGTKDGGGAARGAPPGAVPTLEVEIPAQDFFEVRVLDASRGMRLVGVIELVSPANKDRPDHRDAFVAKCAAYLQEQVGLVVVDVVTSRRTNLHRELLDLLSALQPEMTFPDLYAVSSRNRREGGKWPLDTWPSTLTVGQPLPTLPLWLAGALPVPVNLEATYEETNRVLRIE